MTLQQKVAVAFHVVVIIVDVHIVLFCVWLQVDMRRRAREIKKKRENPK